MGITAQGGGGGASVRLQNLKSPLDINIPEFNVPKLVLDNDGTELEPAITFASSLDTGIFLRGTNDLAFVSEGTEGLRVDGLVNAKNCIVIRPSVIGSGPLITVDGDDADISLNISPRGTGQLNILKNTSITGTLGLGTLTPDPSAILELVTTTKGFLMPRMTSIERLAISSPATGLQVYDTTDDRIFLFDGIDWRATSGVFTTTKSIDSGRAGFSGSADAKAVVIDDQSLVISFVSTQVRSVYFTEDLPASYVNDSDIEVSLMWSPDDANAGDVVWEVELTAITPSSGDTLDGPSTIMSIIDSAPSSQYELIKAATIIFDGTGITSDDILNIRISRLGNDGADTYGNDALLSVVALKFQLSG